VRPVKQRLWLELVGCDAIATIAYRAEHADGSRGPYRRTYAEARADLLERRRAERVRA
jgi:hypothetical protein